jgi:hypothetical protein
MIAALAGKQQHAALFETYGSLQEQCQLGNKVEAASSPLAPKQRHPNDGNQAFLADAMAGRGGGPGRGLGQWALQLSRVDLR